MSSLSADAAKREGSSITIYHFHHFNNKNYLCIIDYNSRFPVVKKLEGLSAESLITTTKIIFAECGIPQK